MTETAKSKDMPGRLSQEIKASLTNDRLPCAEAFQIARKLKVNRRQVGDTANQFKIRIVDCQLGCFQIKKAAHDDLKDLEIDRALSVKVEASQVNDHLPCAVAFKIARELKVTPKEVGDAATKQKTRIINCQLGCFP